MLRPEIGHTEETTVKNWHLKVIREQETEFEKGQHLIITDPCYLFANEGLNEEMWQALVSLWFPTFGEQRYEMDSGLVVMTNTETGEVAQFFFSNTAEGDGHFHIEAKTKSKGVGWDACGDTGVDAGMIGIMTVEDAKKFTEKEGEIERLETSDLGLVMDETKIPVRVEVDGRGNFYGGDVMIFTDDKGCYECEDPDCGGACEMEMCENCGDEYHFPEGCGDYCSPECEEEANAPDEDEEEDEDEDRF